jgi:hypothetical protein
MNAPSSTGEVSNSAGRPLDLDTRNFFEPRFEHDFSRVRVHADTEAANSARALDARAYTVGNDLVFGSGQYAPHSGPGRRLLAHELAHTVQQSLTGTTSGRCLQRQPAGAGPGPAEQELGKKIHEAAAQAAQKVHEKGLDKLPEHVPTSPQQRREPEAPKPPEPGTRVPPENLRPEPREKKKAIHPDNGSPEKSKEITPAAPTTSGAAPKPDPGSREKQLALGIAAQSGPTQAGEVVQGALQDKNYVPGVAVDFLKYFHLQLGILQPTLTLQLTHLKPVQPGAGSAASPLAPPDTAQVGATFSPAILKVGDFTIAPQIGLATALAGDIFGTTKGSGKSGTHGQGLGVINLQVDYPLSKRASLTGVVGTQGGLDFDFGSHATKGVGNITGSFVATFHF